MIDKNESDMLALLRTFYHVAREGNFSNASKRMGITPNSVSLQLQRLERCTHTTLFRHSHNKMELTGAGHILHAKSIAIFQEVRTLRHCLHPLQTSENRIRIATIDTLAYPFLKNCISTFQRLSPKAEFIVTSHNSIAASAMLHSAEVDLALVRQTTTPVPEGIFFKPLFSTRMHLLAHHCFESQISTPYPLREELSTLPYVGFTPSNEFFTYLQQSMKELGVFFQVIHTHSQLCTLLHYVNCGMGVTILDETRLSLVPNLLSYPMDIYFPENTFGVLYRSPKSLPAICQIFLEFLLTDTTIADAYKNAL